MLKLMALLVCCASLHSAEYRLPPLPPGTPVKASLSDMQAAIRTLVALDVATTIQANTNQAEVVAYHFRAIADIFKSMSTDGSFSVEHLNAELAKLPPPPEVDLSGVRTAIVSLYARTYQNRSRAAIPALEFLAKISATFDAAIREGIRNGGKGHVTSQ